MTQAQPALIWCPFGTHEDAQATATQMVTEQLVACGNIMPAMLSIFVHKGAVNTADEVAVLFKTRADLLDRACARLAQLHPYDTPAIMGWHADAAPLATRDWLGELAPERNLP